MKNLPFLKELCEARMFFNANDVKGMSASNVADVVYLIIMMIEIIRRSNPSWAASYAGQTMQYNTYQSMHYSGTDLANLLAVLNNQDTFKNDIKTDKGISIPLFQINRYLSAVRSQSNSHQDDASFFYRLEDYMKLYSKSTFRQLRREIGDWDNLSHADKQKLVLILRRAMDSTASSTDIYLWFRQSFKMKE
jgi:hypothetical protein